VKHSAASATAAKMPLLDRLVGAAGQEQWHGDAERLCGFEIDD